MPAVTQSRSGRAGESTDRRKENGQREWEVKKTERAKEQAGRAARGRKRKRKWRGEGKSGKSKVEESGRQELLPRPRPPRLSV